MREAFQEQLDEVIAELVAMAEDVRTATQRANVALFQADAELAERVISDDAQVDQRRAAIEDRSFDLIARQQPVAGDLRMIVAALRMVGDLERMGDLAVHIAKIARMRYPERALPPAAESTLNEMAAVAEQMVGAASEVIASRDVEAANALEREDETMDRLRQSSFRTLLSDGWDAGVEAAIDVALLGRYYERIADHAVSLARRVIYLVTGEHPVPVH